MNVYLKTTVALVAVSTLTVAAAPPSYDAVATEKWRAERETELRSPMGWLTVAGLYFLKPGSNTIGSNPSRDVVLPASATADDVGVIEYAPTGEVTLRLRNGARATVDQEPASGSIVLSSPDERGRRQAPRVSIGAVSLQVHRSGSRVAIRLRDPESRLLKEFTGLRWHPVDPAWSVTAQFISYGKPRTLPTQNILGDNTESVSPGEVEFTINGTTTRLVAFGEGKRLSFVFSDATSGREAYRLRCLTADAPDARGNVTLDFNRADNPPCAFNPYTTCPIPLPENRLKVAIAAGEKAYHAAREQTAVRTK